MEEGDKPSVYNAHFYEMKNTSVTSSNSIFLLRAAAVMMVVVLGSVGLIISETILQKIQGWQLVVFASIIVLFNLTIAYNFYCSYKNLRQQGLISFWVLILLNVAIHFTTGNLEIVTALL